MVSLRYSSLLLLIGLASGCGALVGIDHDYVEVDGALGDASASDEASRDGGRSDAQADTGTPGDCPGQTRCVASGACVAKCESNVVCGTDADCASGTRCSGTDAAISWLKTCR